VPAQTGDDLNRRPGLAQSASEPVPQIMQHQVGQLSPGGDALESLAQRVRPLRRQMV
jgi:hypothetical protein